MLNGWAKSIVFLVSRSDSAGHASEERRHNYNCDITYATNSELGFDYLRDNMAADISEVVQRDFQYCVIDEVDSILIDEARTPLSSPVRWNALRRNTSRRPMSPMLWLAQRSWVKTALILKVTMKWMKSSEAAPY